LRFKAATNAALCAVALSLAGLSQGCVWGTSAPADGEASASSQALVAISTPAQTAQPTPSPAVKSPLPPPQGLVNDFANVLDAPTKKLLEGKLRQLKQNARIEFAVVTVETTGEQDIFDYSLAVARGWGIGPPAGEEGGGLLLLLAIKDHKWRIHVSRSLEADLPNDVAGEVGRGMTPSLRVGHYGEAINKCVDGLIERLAARRGFSMTDGELILQALPEEKPKPSPGRKP
jgi:uncharacterized protein